MPGIDYTLGMKTAGFDSGIKGALGKLGAIGSKVGLALGSAGLAGGVALAAGIGKAIGKSSQMEGLRTAFIPLLGGIDQAKERIAELSNFAASTPFELPEIAAASKTLETLTRGALATGDGLRIVGDVASGTGQSFEEIAVTIGRLYDGLDSGRPVGEALARLQELGVVSGDVRGKIEELQKEGRKGAEVWAVAESALGRFSGSMELQSQTWNGKLSTLSDNIGMAFAAFGEPIIDAVKPFLDGAIGATGSLTEKAAAFGQKIAEVIGFIAAAFSTGELTSIIGDGLKLAFMESVNFLFAAFRGTIAVVGQLIVEAFRNAVLYFEILTTADFWKGMGNAIIGLFLDAVGFLQKGIAEALEIARPLAELFGKGDSIDAAQSVFRESADILREEAQSRYGQAGDQLGPVAAKIEQRAKDMAANIAERYTTAFEASGNILDTSGTRNSLAASFEKVKKAQQEAAAKTAAAREQIVAGTSASPVTDTTAPASASTRTTPTADRLAQIGGYVGAAAKGLAARAAEKTAAAMEKAVKHLASMDRRLGNPHRGGIFV
jgi:uncharacterized small protein (DUF1192 family)